MPQQKLTINQLAVEFARTRDYTAKVLRIAEPVGKRGKLNLYTCEQFDRARFAEQGDESLRDKKTKEEIRKLELANDEKENLVVRRTWVAEAITKVLVKAIKALENKLLNEMPSKCEGLKAPAIRKHNRRLYDDMCVELEKLGKELRIK